MQLLLAFACLVGAYCFSHTGVNRRRRTIENLVVSSSTFSRLPHIHLKVTSLHGVGSSRRHGRPGKVVDEDVEGDGFRLSFLERVRRKTQSVLKLKEPGSLILVRHGQTALNYNKTFTGWIDTDLSETGEQEMLYAARLLLERGYDIDVTYTSRLKRAIRSSWIMYV